MSLDRFRKAADLEVFLNGDGTFCVPGESAVYTLAPSRETGELKCNCPAGSYGSPCGHRDAVVAFIRERAA